MILISYCSGHVSTSNHRAAPGKRHTTSGKVSQMIHMRSVIETRSDIAFLSPSSLNRKNLCLVQISGVSCEGRRRFSKANWRKNRICLAQKRNKDDEEHLEFELCQTTPYLDRALMLTTLADRRASHNEGLPRFRTGQTGNQYRSG